MDSSAIKLLLAKSQNSYRAALLLLENGFIDSAVARSYYSMFYLAQAFLLSENMAFSSHKAVIAKFGQEFVKTGKVPVKYHRILIDAQIKRNQADYDINSTFSIEEAQQVIVQAEDMLRFAHHFFDNFKGID